MIPSDAESQEKVPLFPTWNYWYALVIFLLVALIFLFFFITKRFA